MSERQFEVLVAPHAVVLTAIAARLVGADDADDVVQEALFRAWRRWSTFDPDKGTVRAWLAAIVVDRARRHRRRRGRADTRGIFEAFERATLETDREQRLMVEAVVRSLPRRQREVVALFYLADLSVEQTARALGLRAGSVKAHLAAARAALKSQDGELMSKSVTDGDVETALSVWAHETVATTTTQPFLVTRATITRRGDRRSGRRVIAALAAATVLVAAAVGLIIRHRGNRTEAPATPVSRCPTSLSATFRTDALPLSDGQPIFTGRVAAMTACSYQDHLLAAVPLDRHLAEQLAQHLNDAAITNHDPLLCLAVPNISVLLARDNHGQALPPVKLIPGCREITVTNGATTRYLNVDDFALQQAETYVRKHS